MVDQNCTSSNRLVHWLQRIDGCDRPRDGVADTSSRACSGGRAADMVAAVECAAPLRQVARKYLRFGSLAPVPTSRISPRPINRIRRVRVARDVRPMPVAIS